ncbi:PREDICTED: protein SLOW GREEN 1, chloroplastic-like [Ipomoea nil]|uniref:protein SLOW GREEN 1, chloroplastic-like n=1 Tax=Ipomoea nil TaxID=35883 RepID=UPI0009013B09|nr:PREDICTED: protein SLOW GREEN 1, chloroplastic-like [Ipomoea nil]
MNAFTHFSAKPNLNFLPSLNNHRPVLVRPLSSLSFTTQPQHVPIKASSSFSPEFSVPKPAKQETAKSSPGILETLTQSHFQTPFSCAVVATVAAAAVFLGRFSLRVNPSIAAPVSAPATAEAAVSDAETEKALQERLAANPNDVEALQSLVESKIQNQNIGDAISIVNRLMELEPSETEWPLLRNHLFVLTGEFETARRGFNEILSKEPLLVEAYHGLITAVSEDDQVEELKGIEERILKAMKLCKTEDKKGQLRDFKLLLAQIRAIEYDYEEALKVYQELVKEEPTDFRPYLYQAIMYTMLGKDKEAKKHFQMYRELLPEGHPYSSFLDNTMIASKLFAAAK